MGFFSRIKKIFGAPSQTEEQRTEEQQAEAQKPEEQAAAQAQAESAPVSEGGAQPEAHEGAQQEGVSEPLSSEESEPGEAGAKRAGVAEEEATTCTEERETAAEAAESAKTEEVSPAVEPAEAEQLVGTIELVQQVEQAVPTDSEPEVAKQADKVEPAESAEAAKATEAAESAQEPAKLRAVDQWAAFMPREEAAAGVVAEQPAQAGQVVETIELQYMEQVVPAEEARATEAEEGAAEPAKAEASEQAGEDVQQPAEESTEEARVSEAAESAQEPAKPRAVDPWAAFMPREEAAAEVVAEQPAQARQMVETTELVQQVEQVVPTEEARATEAEEGAAEPAKAEASEQAGEDIQQAAAEPVEEVKASEAAEPAEESAKPRAVDPWAAFRPREETAVEATAEQPAKVEQVVETVELVQQVEQAVPADRVSDVSREADTVEPAAESAEDARAAEAAEPASEPAEEGAAAKPAQAEGEGRQAGQEPGQEAGQQGDDEIIIDLGAPLMPEDWEENRKKPESEVPVEADLDYPELTRRLREAEARLSVWLDIVLDGVTEAGDELNRRVTFLLRTLEAPPDEAKAFVDDFAGWLERMDYRHIEDFRSELQYRLALALDLEDEEDERSRLFLKLSDSLAKTRAQFARHFEGLISSHGELDDEFWEQLEEIFIMADLGVEASMELTERLRKRAREEKVTTSEGARELLRQEIRSIFAKPRHIVGITPPEVVLMIGVNGAGKTTTIAKLAYRDRMQGKKVMIAAADTFRAAAIEQLQVWAERVGALFHAKQAGSDPASVAYEAMDRAMSEGVDVLYVDTAGRLQTKVNLMDELSKIRNVIARKHPGAPHRTVLVLDATTGQNALSQAKLFKESAGVDELILTKLDGTAKGGVAIAVAMQHKLPITYVGLGEKVEDLRPFNGDDYAEALLKS